MSFRKFVKWKGFPAIYFALFLLSVFYVSLRTGQVVMECTDVKTTACLFFAQILFFAFFSALIRRTVENSFVRKAARFGYTYFCFFLYFIFLLLCGDLLSLLLGGFGITAVWGNSFLWIAALFIAIGITVCGRIHAKQFRHVIYTIPTVRLHSDIRIVLLSDLHMGLFIGKTHIEKMVRRVNEIEPDFVVIAGDLFNNGSVEECADRKEVSGLLREIKTHYGVYAVLGNHDPSVNDSALQTFLKQSGIYLLNDECRRIGHICLAGRRDGTEDFRARTPLTEILTNPVKGQFFPVTFFTKIFQKPGHFYGHAQHGKTHSIISAGAGYFQLPVRIGTDNEIVEIRLKTKTDG